MSKLLESCAGVFRVGAFFLSLRDTALAVAWQNKGYRSAIADVSLESIESIAFALESRLVLWIATTSLRKSRDDRESACGGDLLESCFLDSRIVEIESGLCLFSGAESLAVGFGSLCLFFLPLWDSKIFELKKAFFKPSKEDKT